MSSLRFKQPLRIKGLPKEAESEWLGLEVVLASTFPCSIGCIDEEPVRVWDEELKSYRFDGPFSHNPEKLSASLTNGYLWISSQALAYACQYSNPPRPHILSWLNGKEGSCFEYFQVSENVADYLP